MARPFKRNLTIYKGAPFYDRVVWKTGASKATAVPVDLTGYTARMHIREAVDSLEVLLELATENNRIVLDAEGGIELHISDEDTATIDFTRAVYDLELMRNGRTVRRLYEGRVSVKPEVTRP